MMSKKRQPPPSIDVVIERNGSARAARRLRAVLCESFRWLGYRLDEQGHAGGAPCESADRGDSAEIQNRSPIEKHKARPGTRTEWSRGRRCPREVESPGGRRPEDGDRPSEAGCRVLAAKYDTGILTQTIRPASRAPPPEAGKAVSSCYIRSRRKAVRRN